MSAPDLSVIICTHNPRADFLARALGGLRRQTLPAAQWELILVDNASATPLPDAAGKPGHDGARLVAEPEIGLTAARLRGIAEARAPLLVFVDDDNILAPDYLARAVRMGAAWPMLGVWGCGTYEPEWEEEPPPRLRPYLAYLAVGTASRDSWSNQPGQHEAIPAGAGLCARAAVAARYAANVRADSRRRQLGRTGTGLAGCEDFDLALTALDLGCGTGVFREFSLRHLMPRSRVQEAYLLRLVEGHARSTVLLMGVRDPTLRPPDGDWIARVREWRLRRSLGPVEKRIRAAQKAGERRGWEDLARAADRA